MGYQALLFCPDEKLARVVSQVFSELDFTIDPCTEPFSAVKKLMAQRYDAVVIDCDNEQNSSLLIKSGRTSVPNQSSLAIAIVEGQAGVARAYRIGANLVLTKPINVEQAKGTLRVARGLLRKNLEAAAAGAPPASTAPTIAPAPTPPPTPAARPVEATPRPQEAVSPAPGSGRSPEFEAPVPAMKTAAPPKPEEKPALAAAPALQNRTPVVAQVTPATETSEKKVAAEPSKPPAAPAFHGTSGSQAAGSAPAPAKEIASPAMKPAEKEEEDLFEIDSTPQTQASFSTGALSRSDAPSFAALDNEDAGGSGNKKILIAAAAVLVVAVGGYFGWSKFGQARSNPAPQPVATVSSTPTPSTPSPASETTSAAAPVSSAPTTSRPSAAIPATATKPSSTSISLEPAQTSSSAQKTMLQSEAKTTASAPIVVKSATAKSPARSQVQPDASAAQLPSPLAVASPNDNAIGGLLSSASANVAKPSLATIRVSQGVSQGMVIKRVQPKYPPHALAAHIQGAVQIEATVNKEGIVVNPKVLSGDSVLAAAALEAVRQWRYKPYYLDGEPVEIQTQITINFKATK